MCPSAVRSNTCGLDAVDNGNGRGARPGATVPAAAFDQRASAARNRPSLAGVGVARRAARRLDGEHRAPDVGVHRPGGARHPDRGSDLGPIRATPGSRLRAGVVRIDRDGDRVRVDVSRGARPQTAPGDRLRRAHADHHHQSR